MEYNFTIVGLDQLAAYVGEIPAKQKRAARAALNKAADRARTMGARSILDEINLPASYLTPSAGRLTVSRRATKDNLESAVTGQQRPTSLARFVVGNPQPRSGDPIEVAIKRGAGAVHLERAFVVNLRRGNTDTKGNIGLAVRTSDGQKPRNAYKPQPLSGGAWLLYGPSVDQVFRRVRVDIAPKVADYLSAEYDRVLKVDL